MDPNNDERFASEDALAYWKDVDLYMGGAEHATGHLLYVRFWTKFLFDLGYITIDEPARKLINQGMIQGRSAIVYRIKDSNTFVSHGLKDTYDFTALHVEVNMVENDILDIEAFRRWRDEYRTAEFILEDGKYICGSEIEKMSKRWFNVVNPDDMVHKYGADCLRLYEMFLGPLELSKPWNTNGISGTANFIRKLWKLYHRTDTATHKLGFYVTEEKPDKAELKILHRTIKKVKEDIERFSFNTSVSTFMICVNELTDLKCNKRAILEPLAIIVSPYAPHIAEELWHLLGHDTSVTSATFPAFLDEYLVESEFAYPVSVNGKTKMNIPFPLSLTKEDIEKQILETDEVRKLLNGQAPKKVIVVHGRIVNIVV
jgi:leucyl-tRNA synthetase